MRAEIRQQAPGVDPALPRHWVFADGEVVDDV
jgi:hypothetical protein